MGTPRAVGYTRGVGSGSAKATIDVSGPFFQRNPELTMEGNIRRMMAGIALEGEKAVKSAYPTGPTGAGRRGVKGRVKSLSGKPWMATAVISQTHVYKWPGAGPKEYRGGKTEARYHMWRAAYRSLARSRAVIVANLTAGLE